MGWVCPMPRVLRTVRLFCASGRLRLLNDGLRDDRPASCHRDLEGIKAVRAAIYEFARLSQIIVLQSLTKLMLHS